MPAEFLGYVGTEFLRDSHRKIDDLITLNVEKSPNHLEAREDFLAMVSVLAQYINLPQCPKPALVSMEAYSRVPCPVWMST